MHRTKKENQGRFGVKLRGGVDAETGVAHNMTTTAAHVHDVSKAHRLRHCGGREPGG